ncbi:MAG TPA: glutamate racemase [Gallionella sp.]|nr:glutamate racemase [Gallionella sp.]
MSNTDPIGVFDSGVGGLSVLREIRRELPHEDLLYVADSGHAPYGDKPGHRIEARAIAISNFLASRRAKAIVVACNTATSAAVSTLRARFTLPIIAMEPAVKPAAAHTRSGVVGVLATNGTLGSANFARLAARFGTDVNILVQACPGLAEQVEAGDLAGDRTRALLKKYIAPLLKQGADTLVLGCTHYPFLTPVIRELAGPEVAIIDPAAAVARELRRRLAAGDLLSPETRAGSERFWSSSPLEQAHPLIAQLWHAGISVERLPPEY